MLCTIAFLMLAAAVALALAAARMDPNANRHG